MKKGAILLAAALAIGEAGLVQGATTAPIPTKVTTATSIKIAPKPSLLARAQKLVARRDWIGFRLLVKKAYAGPLKLREWLELKALINIHAIRVGYDMIDLWNHRNPGGKSDIDLALENSDSLMLGGKFGEAFKVTQEVARQIRDAQNTLRAAILSKAPGSAEKLRRFRELAALRPFVFHSMGRALYGAGRFEDALRVYLWIDPAYPRFRQVLFEKMWAGFRAGRVAPALGAIASLRSPYFSAPLSPEVYLIQTYIYRKLCRLSDLAELEHEMKRFEQKLEKADAKDLFTVVPSDVEMRVLWNLSRTKPAPGKAMPEEYKKEIALMKETIDSSLARRRERTLKELRTVMAYAQLSSTPATAAELKPIERIGGRAALLKQNREIWPADSAEEWIDEIGTHQFIGESQCKESKPAS